MNKYNKILSIILTVGCLIGACSIFASASDDAFVVTVKNIIDKWFVNDVEVSKDAYDKVKETTLYEEVIIEHRLKTITQYRINGKEVTEEDYQQYLAEAESVRESISSTYSSTLVFDARDLTGLNAGDLGNYLSFETDDWGNVTAAEIISSDVVGAEFHYAESYLSHTEQREDKYYYIAADYGNVYQDVSEKDFTFKYGQASQVGFYVCEEDGCTQKSFSEGEYLFKFVSDTSTIVFESVFDSITLYLK